MSFRMSEMLRAATRRAAAAALVAFALVAVVPASLRADAAAGSAAFEKGDYVRAQAEWASAAERGDPDAEFGLGMLYERGDGNLKQDYRAAIRWYEIAKQQLWDGERDALVAELQQRAHRLGTPAKGEPEGAPRVILHRNAFSYFPTNHDAVNYPAFRAHGWPIGSGVVEGAVKQFALRLKGSEKFWNVSETGAEEMLALCALSVSEDDRWTRYWVHRAQPYRPS